MKTAISAIGGLILLTGVSVQAQQAVVPGRSIGTITLGMPRLEVWQHIGKPMETQFLLVGGRSYTWDWWQNESGSKREFVTSRYGQVVQIERDVTDDERRKYLFPSLREHHPHLNIGLYIEYEDNGSTIKADDIRQGIAWAVYIHHYKHYPFNTHLLSEIGPDRVIVHRRGTKVLPNPGEIKDEHDSSFSDIRAWFAAKPPKMHKGN